MKKMKYISIAIVALSLVSCNFLDTELYNVAQTENFYKTEDQLNYALNGVYATLNESTLYGDAILGRLGLAADLGYEYYKKDRNTVSYYMTSVSDSKIDGYWRSLYAGINRANILLQHVDDPTITIKDAARNSIKGQTKFLRAYYYYMLVKRFVNIPLVTEPISDTSTEEKFVEQAAPKDVYQFIVDELVEAAELCEKTVEGSEGWKVYNTTCWAMAARAALNMAGRPVNDKTKYAECASYAKKVIDSGVHALNPDYNQIFINYAQKIFDIKESIFEVNFWGDNTGIYSTAGCVGRNLGMASSETSAVGYCLGLQRTNGYIWQIYVDGNEADETGKADADVRCARNINRYHVEPTTVPTPIGTKGREQYNSSYSMCRRYCATFRFEDDGKGAYAERNTNYSDFNFPIMRYADVLLMYAEAYAFDPSSADEKLALECINKVKRRGHGLNIDSPSIYDFNGGATALQEEIMKERAREMPYEMTRKDDLCRWGNFLSQMKYVLANYNEGTGSQYKKAFYDTFMSVTARDETWPIPSRELSVNTKLKQNQGW